MALQESGEMYLETIYVLSKESNAVRAIDIGEYMGFSKPSVSRALGLLRDAELISKDADGFIKLTPQGEKHAKCIYERHTLLTKLLIDIGVDVPVADFVAAVKEHNPDVIGLSCLLTTCFDYMKKTIDGIREAGLDKGKLILIGGGPVDEATVEYVGADARGITAQEAVLKAKEFLGVK